MTAQTRTVRGMNAQGEIVETQVEFDPDVVAERRAFRDAQRQAQSDHQALREQIREKLIDDAIAADGELTSYQASLDAVIAAKPGEVATLPLKPDLLTVARKG